MVKHTQTIRRQIADQLKISFHKIYLINSLILRLTGFDKLLYVRTYVSQKLVVVQKYFTTSTLSYWYKIQKKTYCCYLSIHDMSGFPLVGGGYWGIFMQFLAILPKLSSHQSTPFGKCRTYS